MRRFLGTALFFCSAIFAYQSYLTSRPDPAVREQSRVAACKGSPLQPCEVDPNKMRAAEINSFGHRYRWATPSGDLWVNCRRQWIVFGAWSCEPG